MSTFFYNTVYKFIQHLRGEKVFEVLKQIEKTQWYDKEKIQAMQWQKIKKIITHAYNNVPYYRNKFTGAGVKPDHIQDWNDLLYIPILTKDDLRNNLHFLVAEDKRYHHDRYSTSGSTGPASILYIDRTSAAYKHANVLRAYNWMGLDFADRVVQFWGTQLDLKNRIKDKIKDFCLNRKTFSTLSLDEESMFRYYEKIRRFRPNLIYGFTSAIYEFAQFLIERNLDLEKLCINAVLVTGEPLFRHQREIMEKKFDCRVYVKYGAEEFGSIAYECPEGNLHVMSENVYVEVEKQEQNKEKGNLLITGINNFIMPLIRYRIGDIGIISKLKCNCGRELPIIKEISGRSADFIKTPDGKVMHGINFDYIPKYFLSEIKQFQIIQKEINTVCVNIVKDTGFNKQTSNQFEKKLRVLLGNKINIQFVFKEAIPREKTGKTRFVSSMLKRKETLHR